MSENDSDIWTGKEIEKTAEVATHAMEEIKNAQL
jgi:hypothetical protein